MRYAAAARMTPAVADVLLVEARGAFLARAVEVPVRARRESALSRCLEEREMARVGIGRVRDGERPARASIVGRAAGVVLGAAEIRQHLAEAPRRAGLGRPGVEAQLVSAHVGHRADRARPAVRLAAGPPNRPPAEARIGFGRVVPVHGRPEEGRPLAWRLNQRVRVRPAGLEQQDTVPGIRREPVGQHAAGRSRADDDEVEFGIARLARITAGASAAAARNSRRDKRGSYLFSTELGRSVPGVDRSLDLSTPGTERPDSVENRYDPLSPNGLLDRRDVARRLRRQPH